MFYDCLHGAMMVYVAKFQVGTNQKSCIYLKTTLSCNNIN